MSVNCRAAVWLFCLSRRARPVSSFLHGRFHPSLPPLVWVANWLDVIALAVGRRARRLHGLLHGATSGNGAVQAAENQRGEGTYRERMSEAAWDVWRRIPKRLAMDWYEGGRKCQRLQVVEWADGIGREASGSEGVSTWALQEQAGVAGLCALTRPSRAKRK